MKRQPIKRIHFFLLILNLILIFLLFFGYRLGLMGNDLNQAEIFLAIILVFFLCLSQFVSFSESESQAATISALEERLTESFKYIGKINLLVEEFRDVFFQKKRYPRTKAELKKTINDYADRILSISKSDWVIIRIINLDNFNTVIESNIKRPNLSRELDNHAIIRKRCGCYVVNAPLSDCRNRVYCLLPKDVKDKELSFFVASLVGQLEMMTTIALK
jgi:hypothetical protein